VLITKVKNSPEDTNQHKWGVRTKKRKGESKT